MKRLIGIALLFLSLFPSVCGACDLMKVNNALITRKPVSRGAEVKIRVNRNTDLFGPEINICLIDQQQLKMSSDPTLGAVIKKINLGTRADGDIVKFTIDKTGYHLGLEIASPSYKDIQYSRVNEEVCNIVMKSRSETANIDMKIVGF